MRSVADQIIAFFLIVGLGLVLGFIYDCYRTLRAIWRPGWWGTIIGDLIFWLFLTGFTFFYLLLSIWGEMRFYIFLALILGVLLYLKYGSKKISPYLKRIYILLGKLVKGCLRIILLPLLFIYKLFLFPLRLVVSLGMFFVKGARRVRQAIKGFWQRIKKEEDQDPPENLT